MVVPPTALLAQPPPEGARPQVLGGMTEAAAGLKASIVMGLWEEPTAWGAEVCVAGRWGVGLRETGKVAALAAGTVA